MIRVATAVLASLSAIAWMACASSNRIPVSTAFDPLERFPAQASFAWDRAKIKVPEDPQLSNLGLGEIVEEETRAALAEKMATRATR